MIWWHWHQLDHIQIVCTLLETDYLISQFLHAGCSSWPPTNSVKALKAICLGSRGTGKASGWQTCSNYSQRFSWMTQPGLGWLQKRRRVKWKPNLCVSFHWIVCKEDRILILHVEVLSVISLWISCEYMPPACCRILVTCIRSVRSFTTRWPCLRTPWKKRVKRNGESHGSSGWRHSAGGAVVTRTAWKATDIRCIQTRAGSRSWWLYVPSCWLASFFFQAFWKRTFGDKWHRFLRAGCPSCHPTNSVSIEGNTKHRPKQWPGLILSSSMTGLLMKAELLPFAGCVMPVWWHLYEL